MQIAVLLECHVLIRPRKAGATFQASAVEETFLSEIK
jgi:hypothetical protein